MFLIYRENTAEMYEVKYFEKFSTKMTLLSKAYSLQYSQLSV